MNNVRMPEQNLSPEMIAGLLKFFAACGAKGGCDPISGPKLGIDGTAEEIAAGRDLFVGAKSFANGGPACAQCHHARGVGLLGGGTVGPDLTFSWAKLHDAPWAEALLQSPLEKKAYEGHALSDVEKFQLRSFFADLSRDGTRDPAPEDFFDIGLLSGLATLGFIGIFWVSRNGGART
jgi:mono/diheme cytochrome c family protein